MAMKLSSRKDLEKHVPAAKLLRELNDPSKKMRMIVQSSALAMGGMALGPAAVVSAASRETVYLVIVRVSNTTAGGFLMKLVSEAFGKPTQGSRMANFAIRDFLATFRNYFTGVLKNVTHISPVGSNETTHLVFEVASRQGVAQVAKVVQTATKDPRVAQVIDVATKTVKAASGKHGDLSVTARVPEKLVDVVRATVDAHYGW